MSLFHNMIDVTYRVNVVMYELSQIICNVNIFGIITFPLQLMTAKSYFCCILCTVQFF